ncbi:MAG TPA: FtsX-like permease family protein [Kineosporiaceae bacterium]|nr:FtsX-like permease family protein [Kineosporiaceae bacterium]
MNSFGAGSRATLRLARRDAWRNRARSSLIALMIAIPVLSMSAVSVVYRSDQREAQDTVTLALGEQSRNQAAIRSGGGVVVQAIDGSNYLLDGDAVGGAEPVRPSGRKQAAALLSTFLPSDDRVLEDRSESLTEPVRHGSRTLSSKTVREFDYSATGADGPIKQVAGRAPKTPNEVVVTQQLARSDHLQTGDVLDRASTTGNDRLTVVGVVGGVSLIGESALIALPGALLADQYSRKGVSVRWLVVGPTAVDWGRVLRLNDQGFAVTSRAVVAAPPPVADVPFWRISGGTYDIYNPESPLSRIPELRFLPTSSAVGVITVAIGLILLQVALMAGPAIAVGARRNERALALLATAGGNPRQMRAVVLATSGVIGLVGSTIAAGLGAGVGVIGVGLLRRYQEQQIVRTDVHLLDLVVLVGVGTVTAVAAAVIPARQAARLDVVAVLTGRRSRPKVPRRIPVIAVLVALIGGAVCYLGATHRAPFTTMAGIALAEIGLVAGTGSIIALVAKAAGGLPFAARFALRDALRQRSRTAPAVAAVMAAIAGSLATGVYLQSSDANRESQYRVEQAAVIGSLDVAFEPRPTSESLKAAQADGAPDVVELQPVDAATTSAVVGALRRTLPVRELAVYQTISGGRTDLAVLRPLPGEMTESIAAELNLLGRGRQLSAGFFDDGSALRIQTGASDPVITSALREGRVVVFSQRQAWPDNTVHVRVTEHQTNGKTSQRTVKLPAVVVSPRLGLNSPVFPPSTARALGVQLSPIGVLASTTRTPTTAQEKSAEAAVSQLVPANMQVERGYQGQVPVGLLALVIATTIIALGGTFTAVGLAAAEGKTDVATLAAVGASPAVRRRLASAHAAVITLLGSGLGLLTGLLAGWALVRLHQPPDRHSLPADLSVVMVNYLDGWPLAIPWSTVALVVLGVPVLAIGIGFLTTRSRLPLVRRLGQ